MNATPSPGAACSVTGCPNFARTRGLCNGHYKRLRKHGDVQADVPLPQEPVKPPCSIPGCGGKVLARGWCAKHYNAWTAHGDPLVNLQVRRTEHPCSVDGCENPWRALGLCSSHYTRLQVLGDIRANVPLRAYSVGRTEICSVDGCMRVSHAKGLCSMHYTQARLEQIRQEPCVIPECPRPRYSADGWCIPHYRRWKDYGDPLGGPPPQSPHSPNPRPCDAASPEYQRNHRRVRVARGPAWLQVCEHCGGRAWDWATTHGRSGAGPADFMPLCKSCHHRYDGLTWPVMRGEAHGNAKLTDAAVRDIRARRAFGERVTVMAREYGVTPESIWNVIKFRTWKHVA